MSLTTPGVWQPGVWNPSVWAQGVWFEGEKVTTDTKLPQGSAPFFQQLRPFEEIGQNRFLKRRVRKVIEEVAQAQVQHLELDESQRLDHLIGELDAQGLEYDARYLEALNQYRDILIGNEIKTILRNKDENEAMLLIMIAAYLT